jgi:hypothetical protein
MELHERCLIHADKMEGEGWYVTERLSPGCFAKHEAALEAALTNAVLTTTIGEPT